ncbi:NUDIX domain-containing protein [Clostridium sp. 'deep sea']|uniref:NUDIX hydrolase n=1 Tax=Clostridium sp. 'deep sea' TaxID=2779445 RepID=UPI0018968EA9|nr:NUDIX domain-containing protein [Clostridium sp. 'deep sea']QOR34179.1 NUDIX domain-containing protein [Clostridium sp. 'deep sea']
MRVNFYEFDEVQDELLKFAVLGTRYHNKWVFVKHQARDTWEVPGGHREANEDINDTAKRELYEETGAIDFKITPICNYSVSTENTESFGRLFLCEVFEFEKELNFEINVREYFNELPINLTYPGIQPYLHDKFIQFLNK